MPELEVVELAVAVVVPDLEVVDTAAALDNVGTVDVDLEVKLVALLVAELVLLALLTLALVPQFALIGPRSTLALKETKPLLTRFLPTESIVDPSDIRFADVSRKRERCYMFLYQLFRFGFQS